MLNEPSGGVSRRSLLQRAGALLAAGGVLTAAGCENTTDPVAQNVQSGGKGLLGDPTAGGPVDASGIPLARRDYPVTLPRIGDPVKPGKPERGGELKIYNYDAYLDPAVTKEFGRREGVQVTVTPFTTLEEAFSKLSTGRVEFDVLFSTPDQLSRLVARHLIQPLNFDLLGNLVPHVWHELHSPFYDVGPRYSIPYVVYTTGIGWRNDVLAVDPGKLDNPWNVFWEAERYRGRVGILDDFQEGLGLGLLRRGVTNLNTDDPALIARSLADLQELSNRVRVKVGINDYETLPAKRTVLHQSWSGDLITAVISYLPKGTKGDVLSYWHQPEAGPLFNDVICVAAGARKPVLAHKFLNYMLDPKVAYANFVNFVGYQPPQNSIDATKLFTSGVLPPTLRQAVVTHEDYANANAYLTLSASGQQIWDRAWAQFRNG